MDFSLKENYAIEQDLDISFESTENKNVLIVNTLFEKGRLFKSLAKNQSILSRGGSIKDTVYNINNYTGGSIIWYLIKYYNGNDLISRIKTEIDKKLLFLKNNKIIDSYNIDSIYIQNRTLVLFLFYTVNKNSYTLKTTQNLDI